PHAHAVLLLEKVELTVIQMLPLSTKFAVRHLPWYEKGRGKPMRRLFGIEPAFNFQDQVAELVGEVVSLPVAREGSVDSDDRAVVAVPQRERIEYSGRVYLPDLDPVLFQYVHHVLDGI